MVVMDSRATELIAALDLRPHPEGGFYRELFKSARQVAPADGRGTRAALTTIYFLLPAGHVSRWHQVASDEVWHLHEGGPLELLELDAGLLAPRRHVLGAVAPGQAPVCTIPAGHWQAARPLSGYALVGCTVGPGFDFADFRLLSDDAALATRLRTQFADLAALL
jgi:predicted cupin superfamily sugar epimerase